MSASKTYPLDVNWRTVLHDLGVNPADVLRRARLPEDLLSRTGATLKTTEWFSFWDALEVEIDVPHFPILLAEVLTAEAFSPPIFAALCSPNLVVAAGRLREYKRLIAPMEMQVNDDDDEFKTTLRWLDTELEPPRSIVAGELAFFARLARLSTREHVLPLRVTAPRPPEPADAYRRFFGVGVEVDAEVSITFSAEDARRPFLTANEAMWNAFEPELRRRLAELGAGATVRDRVGAALLESLPSGQTSMESVARRLAVSTRTLQRRLKEENTSFAKILASTRERLARHYLLRTTVSSSEIAFLLGFEEPSSFFRAFHDWTGTTPEALRGAEATVH